MTDRVIVIGAGHAAGQLSARLRAEKYEGEVVIVGEEPVLPYQRPPLSKAYMAGEIGLERVVMRTQKFYDDNNIDVRTGVRVTAIDSAARTITLDSGESLEYSHAVIATGTRARTLPLDGAELGGIHVLRSLADSDAVGAALETAKRMVVVGGGYIGLEVAAVARKRGLEVVVLETMDRILGRTTSERTAQHVAEVHASNGVEIRVNASVSGFRGNEAGQVDGVVLDGGDVVPADVVVLGVGVLPNEELAAEAGLAVDNGVVVDARGATSDPNVWAVGDCTRHPSRLYGKQIRLESVQNAMSQAKVVAANIAGNDAQYDEVPWFWTDQYDLKLQSVGLIDDADDFVTRGDPSSGSFTVFALQNGRIVGAESVNSMREHMECRRLAGAQARVDSATLADPEVILKELP